MDWETPISTFHRLNEVFDVYTNVSTYKMKVFKILICSEKVNVTTL